MFSRTFYCMLNSGFKLPANFMYSKFALRRFSSKINNSSTIKSTLKYSLIGASVGTFIGVGYFIHSNNNTNIHVTQSEEVITLLKDVPKIEPSRRVSFEYCRISLI